MVGSISNCQSPQLNKTPSRTASSSASQPNRSMNYEHSTSKYDSHGSKSKCSPTLNLPIITPSPMPKTITPSTSHSLPSYGPKSHRSLVSIPSTEHNSSSPSSKHSFITTTSLTPDTTSKTMCYSTPVSSISKRISRASELFDTMLKEFHTHSHSKIHPEFNPMSSSVSSSARSTSEDLRFSRTYLLNLESILLRRPNPSPEIKEALHMIKKDINSYKKNMPKALDSEFEVADYHNRPSKQSQRVSRAGQALVASTLAANALSHSSFRPKRRTHKSPGNIQVYPHVKKTSSSSYFMTTSPFTPEKKRGLKSEPSSPPTFPKILSTPPKESREKPSSSQTKSNLKKEFNTKTIFSSSRKLPPSF